MSDRDSPAEGLRAVALVVLVVGASLPVSMAGTAAAAAGNSTDGFVYVDGSDGDLKSVRADSVVVDYGVGDAKVIGPRADIDGDGDRDVPFVDSNGALKIVDDGGTTQQLGDLSSVSPRTTKSKLAIGDWDGDGNTSTDAVTVTVEDRTAPTATLSGGDTTVGEDESVSFDASGSTDNVGVDSYEWDLDGDGSTDATGATASSSYAEPGTYVATVSVSDGAGNTATGSHTITVAGPDATGIDTSLPYGDTATDTTTVRDVTVENNGTAPLNLTDVSLSGADTDAYALTGTAAGAPTVVAPGESVRLAASFSPSTTGSKSTAMAVATNDSDTGTASVALSGTGVDSDLSVNDSTLSFGGVEAGETATARVTMTNDGAAAATVTDVTVNGTASEEFSVTDSDGLPGDIAAGATRTLTVGFSPDTTGDLTATLSVTTDDGVPASVALEGTGHGPDAHPPADGVDFGEIGKTETTTANVTLDNHGDRTRTVDDVSVTGTDADAFAVAAAPATVAANGSAGVELTYDPPAAGTHNATLSVTGDDPDEPTVAAPLDGSAVAADIGADRQTLNFGNVTVGETTFLNITVQNLATSKVDLTVTNTPIVGTDPDDFAVNRGGGPFSLAPGKSRDVEVAFTPTTAETKQAQIQLLSDAADKPQVSVWLSNDETYIVVQQVNEDRAENTTVNVSQPGSRDETVGFEELDMSVDDADSFEINVTHAEGPPTANSEQYDPDSGRDTLQYVRLNHSVDAGDTYNDTAVSYRVEKADVPAGADPEEVRLHRWDGSDWSFESSGTLVAETASEYVYRADTPGFSQFILTGPEGDTDGGSGGSGGTDSSSLAGATTETDGSARTTAPTTATTMPGDDGPDSGGVGTAAPTTTATPDSVGGLGLGLPLFWLAGGGVVTVPLLLLALLRRRDDDEEEEPEEPH